MRSEGSAAAAEADGGAFEGYGWGLDGFPGSVTCIIASTMPLMGAVAIYAALTLRMLLRH
jgi:hypothetical protein